MKIKCLTTFLDGRDRFEKDDVRTVEDDRGAYFVANGWATAGGEHVEPVSGAVTLDVQNAVMGQKVKNG